MRVIRAIFRQEAAMLVASLAIVAGTWGFIELADDVLEGDTQAFDEWTFRLLRHDDEPRRPIGPDWLVSTGMDITALGSVTVLLIVIVIASGYLWLQRKHHAMWLVIVATIGGQILSSVMKLAFARPRPDEMLHLAKVYTASFPSGHSMLSAVVYLTLGALLARVEPRKRVKTYLITVALLVTGLVGISRVYIGVHYATDVLAGWSAGLTWALACWVVARYLQRRGAVESDTQPTAE